MSQVSDWTIYTCTISQRVAQYTSFTLACIESKGWVLLFARSRWKYFIGKRVRSFKATIAWRTNGCDVVGLLLSPIKPIYSCTGSIGTVLSTFWANSNPWTPSRLTLVATKTADVTPKIGWNHQTGTRSWEWPKVDFLSWLWACFVPAMDIHVKGCQPKATLQCSVDMFCDVISRMNSIWIPLFEEFKRGQNTVS